MFRLLYVGGEGALLCRGTVRLVYFVSVVARSVVVVGHGWVCAVRYLVVVMRTRRAEVGDLYLVEYR